MPAPAEPAVVSLILKLAEAGDLALENDLGKRVLSIHDRWLRDEEAADTKVSFKALDSLWSYRYYLGQEDKFVALFAFLFRNSDVYCFEPHSMAVLPLDSWQLLIDLVTTGLREKQQFVLYIHRYELLLASASDLKVAAYFLDPQHQSSFAELAQAYQLYLL
jgi:hypothetical protein